MGIQFSTTNYEKIIDVIDPPYLEPFNFLNDTLTEVVNIDNDNRFLVYRHKTKNIFLFYIGNLCAITNCFEVSEQLLLMYSKQFNDFFELKKYIIKLYSKKEIISELIKYETSNDVSILNYLEMGCKPEFKTIDIDIDFTDSEVDSESEESYEYILNEKNNLEEDTRNYDMNDTFDNIFKDEFKEVGEFKEVEKKSEEIEEDINNSLNNFESFFDNRFSYDINNDWSLEWNNNPVDINRMPIINEINISIKDELPIEKNESLDDKELVKVLEEESIELVEDREDNDNNDDNDDDDNEFDEVKDSSEEEKSPKPFTSIFEKIIPDFNYFNFFN